MNVVFVASILLAASPSIDTRDRYSGSLKALRAAVELQRTTGEDTGYLEGLLDFYSQRAYPYDRIDWGAYRRAEAHLARMPNVHRSATEWTYMGPRGWTPPVHRVYHGDTIVCGRINALAISPHNADHILAGLPSGGVVRSTDRGVTWSSLTDADPAWVYLPVTSVAFDPRHAHLIYAGAGDYHAALPNSYRQDPFVGMGIRAYPYGLWQGDLTAGSWTQLAPQDGDGDYFEGQCVSYVAVEPRTSGYLLATTGRGVKNDGKGKVWRYDTVAQTWSNPVVKDGAPVEAEWSALSISAVEETPTRRRIYVAGHREGRPLLYRSVNRGVTWTEVEITPIKDRDDLINIRLATSPVTPSRVYLAAAWHDGAPRFGIWRSNDAGATWTNIRGMGLPETDGISNNFSQAAYDMHLTCAAPTLLTARSQDILYLGLITLAATNNPTDNDPTWFDIGESYAQGAFNSTSKVHNDQQCMAVDPTDQRRVINGSDGGLTEIRFDVTINDWVIRKADNDVANTLLRAAEFYNAAFHPDDSRKAIGGTQDNSVAVSREGSGDPTWETVSTGDGASGAFRYDDPRIQYSCGVLGYDSGSNRFYAGVFRTATEWSELATWSGGAGPEWCAFFLAAGEQCRAIPVLIADHNAPFDVYFLSDRVRRHDTANSWPVIDASNDIGLPDPDYLMALGVSTLPDWEMDGTIPGKPVQRPRMYVGSFEGRLRMRKWGYAAGHFTWYALAHASLPVRAITSLAVNPLDPNILYVGYSGTGSGHVYRVVVDGASIDRVTNISGAGDTALPDLPVNALALDPANPNLIYAGTDAGALISMVGSDAWSRISPSSKLPNVRISSLQSLVNTGYVHAATYGLGLYKLDRFSSYRFFGGEYDGRKPIFNEFSVSLDHPPTHLVFDDVDVPHPGAIIDGFTFRHFRSVEAPGEHDVYFEIRKDMVPFDGGTLVASGWLKARMDVIGFHEMHKFAHRGVATFPKHGRIALPPGTYYVTVAPIDDPGDGVVWLIQPTSGFGGVGSPIGNGNSYLWNAITYPYIPVHWVHEGEGPYDYAIGLLLAARP